MKMAETEILVSKLKVFILHLYFCLGLELLKLFILLLYILIVPFINILRLLELFCSKVLCGCKNSTIIKVLFIEILTV